MTLAVAKVLRKEALICIFLYEVNIATGIFLILRLKFLVKIFHL